MTDSHLPQQPPALSPRLDFGKCPKEAMAAMERAFHELLDLEQRLAKLEYFLATGKYAGDQESLHSQMLHMQRDAMALYAGSLRIRLNLFRQGEC